MSIELEKDVPKELEGLNKFSRLLDTQFRIPGTSIRFGVDFIIGLFPYAGDILGFLFSSGLILTMVKYGASGSVIAKMMMNILLDATLGSIPILGDTFDLFFKANRRNYELLLEHYGEQEHQGSFWSVLIPVLLTLVLVFILMIWLIVKLMSVAWSALLN